MRYSIPNKASFFRGLIEKMTIKMLKDIPRTDIVSRYWCPKEKLQKMAKVVSQPALGTLQGDLQERARIKTKSEPRRLLNEFG